MGVEWKRLSQWNRCILSQWNRCILSQWNRCILSKWNRCILSLPFQVWRRTSSLAGGSFLCCWNSETGRNLLSEGSFWVKRTTPKHKLWDMRRSAAAAKRSHSSVCPRSLDNSRVHTKNVGTDNPVTTRYHWYLWKSCICVCTRHVCILTHYWRKKGKRKVFAAQPLTSTSTKRNVKETAGRCFAVQKPTLSGLVKKYEGSTGSFGDSRL